MEKKKKGILTSHCLDTDAGNNDLNSFLEEIRLPDEKNPRLSGRSFKRQHDQ